MYARLLNPPTKKSFFLFGPRATGKTTWVKSAFPHALYLDLLESELFTDLLANPSRLANYIPKSFTDWVVIDEVQRVPELLNEVHRLIEKDNIHFILTGSSARKLRKKGHNLLAGRALTYSLHPLTAAEQGSDFSLEKALLYGQLPSLQSENNQKKYLESYISTYLEQEIQQEGLTRNLGAFTRFLETTSFSQGSVLNMSSVAREAALGRKVAENYFSILEDLLIGYRIYPFTKRAERRLVAHPKFYFFDVGVYRALRPMGPLDKPEMIEGTAMETLFFQELQAINTYFELGYTLYYYRTGDNKEVDFVLYGSRGIRAFEIKRSKKVSSADLGGLKTFMQDYPEARAYCAYGGERSMQAGEIELIPFAEMIQNVKKYLA